MHSNQEGAADRAFPGRVQPLDSRDRGSDEASSCGLPRCRRRLDASGERVVVAHSLSCVLWLHAAARGMKQLRYADRVLLVAPPSGSVLARYPEVAAFAPPAPDFTLPGPTRLVAGDDDPYCPEGAGTLFAEPLGLPADILPGAAHLDLEAGYDSWPAVLDWCVDGIAPLTPRPGLR
ncbi:alpha/beta hydrolase [Streptomyces sp. NPDC088810]|uniref:alpha/beta hydrolase n=1 Tax=Streptomyces sp. NPDC088810 TaxID=3365904 RepID=UPI0037F98646